MTTLGIDRFSNRQGRHQSLQPGLIDSTCRRVLVKKLNRLVRGEVSLNHGQDYLRFGTADSDLKAEVTVHHPRFYRRAVLGGGLGIARSLIDGDWSCDDLTSLVRIFIRNLEVSDRFERGVAWFFQRTARAGHWLRRNTRVGAARNIHEHYDLGNDFYQLFLDETMSYSCGVFEQPSSTMHDASLAKLERVCRHLSLESDDHLLEIGTGWGGLAIYAAKNFGCQVTTTTISREQYNLAVERVQSAGLADRVTVLLSDYRDLEGK
ncbi:MAG: class I SAM-dependent methyltransferase, partial [Gimesia sp.]|nr:class I SAM-dependent methyltransferase [Gimesia sp.]